ncbi:hypothetical protein [Hasllibacter sp. MH4015]|uniref:hypothetical protein n=1 Tax=Hasllibacter sp. MH4015 TaxID=2854029 RepID=UPI001CD60739|nr:hypothetical protein [Hasllibacter sp. MH4015]
MKKIALIAAVAATVAAPAFAQSAASIFAFDHFNQSAESTSDLRFAPSGENTSRVASTGALGTAFDVVNASQDTPSDLRGLNGATLVNGTPAHGADIFDRLRAASLEDE